MNAEWQRDNAVNFDLLNRFRTNPAGLRSLIQSFLTTTPDILRELQQSLQNRNDEHTRNLLHALAGSALNTGAVSLATLCTQLTQTEEIPTATSLPIASLIEQFDQARVILQRFSDDLPAEEQQVAVHSPGDRPWTLLLVEDHPSARQFVRLALADRYRLVEAVDGRQALQLAASESPDLAIVDLNLGPSRPDSPSGFRLLQQLSDQMPTIVLTVDQRPASIQRAIASGAWTYLTKSPDLHNLSVFVDVALARATDLYRGKAETNTLDIATGWLMATYRLDPHAARQALVRLASEKRCSAVEIAQELLDSHQLH
ncbi:MAG: response regulator, partial [Candidatus Competibacteraceae bacterium]|nr:response regulator [Candidatus Competibacteraceae bacterium]